METVSEALVSQCISVLRKDIGIAQFESWLYEYSELLEEELDYGTYLEWISINYTSKFVLQAGRIEFVSFGTYIDKRSEQEKLEERY